ncbi:MAG: trypco2 family protein [Pseudomonadota bacterium]
MAFDEHALGLSAALASLRADLTSAAEAGAGEKFAFRIDEVKLGLTLVASSKIGGEAGGTWFVLSAKASGEVSDVGTQKVTPCAASARRFATGSVPWARTPSWASAVPEVRRRPGSLLRGGGPDPKIAGAVVGGRTLADGQPAVALCHAPAPAGTGRACGTGRA